MTEKTLAEEIITIIRNEANNNPPPEQCTVIGNYTNESDRIDIETSTGKLTYIKCMFSNTIGHTGILIYPNGDLNNPIAIIEHRSI